MTSPEPPSGRRVPHLLIAAGVVAVLFVAALLFHSDPAGRRGGGAQLEGEAFMERLRAVPPERVTHRLDRRIPAGADATALAIGPDDTIHLGGPGGVRQLAPDGGVARSWPTARPVRALAVDEDGLVYVAGDRLEVFTPEGSKVLESEPLPADADVVSMAVGGGSVYLGDAAAGSICRMDLGGMVLNWIGRDPRTGEGRPFVVRSRHLGLAVDADGLLWVAHGGRFRVEQYRVDGTLVRGWGRPLQDSEDPLAGFAGCCNPTHLAVTPEGLIVTSERSVERVKLYTPEGRLVGVVAPPSEFDPGATGLATACDSRGRIHVLNPRRQVIQVYSPVEPSQESVQ